MEHKQLKKGLIFGRLTVISFHEKIKRKFKYKCECTCGNTCYVISEALKIGSIKSCGCLKIEQAKSAKHGGSMNKKPTAEYRTWLSIKERCLNKSSKAYPLYGGRGIGVYEEWVYNYTSFLKYVGLRPSKEYSIDRYPDNNKGYEPGNVRWATRLEQMHNLRKNINLTYNGETKVLAEWARILEVNHEAIRYYLKNGRTLEQMFSHYKKKREGIKLKVRWNP